MPAPKINAPSISALSEMSSTELTWAYEEFCAQIGCEAEGSSDELLCELCGNETKSETDKSNIAWLKSFIAAWDAIED